MANLIIQENGAARTRPAVNGEEITITARCDCSAVTGVQINGSIFPFYDAAGNCLETVSGLFVAGSLIRVLIDTDNQKAILLTMGRLAGVKLMLAADFDAVTDWTNVLAEGEIAWRLTDG